MSESKLSTFSESLFWKDFNIHQENMFDLSKTEFINYHTLAWQLGTLSEQQKGYEYFQKLPQWPPAISTAAEGLVFQKACYQIKNNREKKKKKTATPTRQTPLTKILLTVLFLKTISSISSQSPLKISRDQTHPRNKFQQADSGRVWSLGFFLHCK